MRIGLACNSWNQPEGLARLLESCKEFDRKMVIDGRYYERKDGPEYSGYEDICKKYDAELYLKSNCKEYEKRNIYFEKADDLDCVIIIDDDETPTKWNRKTFEESLEARKTQDRFAYNVNFWENNTLYEIPRVFINPTKCYYKDRHNMVWSGNMEILGRMIGPRIDGIELKHDKHFRESFREANNRLYRQAHAFE